MSGVEVRGVSIRFAAEPRPVLAVDEVSLRIGDGEFVCIVGPSGCGKSTLLNVIGGLVPPSGGEVLVDGRRVSGPGPDRGMVFQSYSLFHWLTVRQNIEFGLKLAGLPAARRREISSGLLAMVRLGDFADAYPKNLSGGMRQRVAIARALATNPDVLLMDEPFGALDAQTRSLMQELLLEVWERYRRTIVFVTHDIDEAIFLADRVLIMTHRPGRIRMELAIGLPRPRGYEVVASEAFLGYKRQILDIVHEESLMAEGTLGRQGP
jgi:NitT/TauT family transport system ATP-binding protein